MWENQWGHGCPEDVWSPGDNDPLFRQAWGRLSEDSGENTGDVSSVTQMIGLLHPQNYNTTTTTHSIVCAEGPRSAGGGSSGVLSGRERKGAEGPRGLIGRDRTGLGSLCIRERDVDAEASPAHL